MALTDRSIVTLNQLKDFLGINPANTSKDDMLEDWIDWVSGKLEAEIENVVKVVEKTVYVDGDGTELLFPPFYPINALDSDDGTSALQYRTAFPDTWSDLVSDTDYIHISTEDQDRLELLGGKYFPWGNKNIKLHYWPGFSEVPGDIMIAVLEALQLMWNNSKQGADRLGKSSMSMSTQAGSTAEAYFDVTPRWRDVVRRYKKQLHNTECYR